MMLLSFETFESVDHGKLGFTALHRMDDDPTWEASSSLSSCRVHRDMKRQPFTATALQRCRMVRFNDDVQKFEIEALSAMSSKDKKKKWYRKKDLKQFRIDCQATSEMIKQGELICDSDELCVLGLLESRSHPYAHQRFLHKILQRSLVFEIQERHRRSNNGGKVDPIVLAGKSLDFSARCRHASFIASLPKDRTPKRGYIN